MTSTPLPHDHGQPPEPTLAAMPDTESFQTIAELLKQLGDSSRIRIFWLLCHCEECVINLSACLLYTSCMTSRPLQIAFILPLSFSCSSLSFGTTGGS